VRPAGNTVLLRRWNGLAAEIVPVRKRAVGGDEARLDESGVVVFEQYGPGGAVFRSPAVAKLPELVDTSRVDVVPCDGGSAPVSL
jgi:hypothetical protein